jgi:hypothetical protein
MPRTSTDDRSLGELVSEATHDISTLMHQELELAKAEIKADVAAAGKGIGAFGAAGFSAVFALLFLSLAAVGGLRAAGLGWGVAALAVGAAYGVLAAVLAVLGKRSFAEVDGVPRTARTLKEDVEWARHPTSS